jgi:hypothetical protein
LGRNHQFGYTFLPFRPIVYTIVGLAIPNVVRHQLDAVSGLGCHIAKYDCYDQNKIEDRIHGLSVLLSLLIRPETLFVANSSSNSRHLGQIIRCAIGPVGLSST